MAAIRQPPALLPSQARSLAPRGPDLVRLRPSPCQPPALTHASVARAASSAGPGREPLGCASTPSLCPSLSSPASAATPASGPGSVASLAGLGHRLADVAEEQAQQPQATTEAAFAAAAASVEAAAAAAAAAMSVAAAAATAQEQPQEKAEGPSAQSNGAPGAAGQYPSCPKWRRVLLKVSGEALAGDGTSNIDPKVTASIAQEVALITRLGVQVGIVVGGGNFFRGAAWAGASGLDRASADHIGMMATVMNAIFLQGSLEALGVPTRVQTAFRMSEVAEPYIRRRAIRHLEKGRVVIFAAGTGNPFFTTDTAAALRAAEIDAEVVLKGTNVDGVYDCDPRKHEGARLLQQLSLREVTVQNLRVMDITAATLCAENNIPVVVFNLNTPGNITRALSGEPVGTLVSP